MKPSEVSFGLRSVSYLGHVISAEGVTIGTERIQATQELRTPASLKEPPSVLFTLNAARRFVLNFAEIAEPLVALTHQGHNTPCRFKEAWGPSQDAAFARIQHLQSLPGVEVP